MEAGEENDKLIAEVTSKREDEQKKIEALKQRLMMIKRESEISIKKQEDFSSLRSQLDNLLQNVTGAFENLEKTFEQQKGELNRIIDNLKQSQEQISSENKEKSTGSSTTIENDQKVHAIENELLLIQAELENSELKEENQKLVEENEELKLELNNYKEKLNLLQKQVTTSKENQSDNIIDPFNDNIDDRDETAEELLINSSEYTLLKNRIKDLKTLNQKLTSQKEYLLTKLRHLQRSFDSEESLCRALFGDLGAEKITNYTRAGYLVKQGGTVKSWKRRYFILKDNFLFYYKRPKDDSPTGIILLDEYSVGEYTQEDSEKKNCFKIDTANRVWMLQAERQIDMDIWIENIAQAALWFDVSGNMQNNLEDLISEPAKPTINNVAHKKSSFRLTTYLSSVK